MKKYIALSAFNQSLIFISVLIILFSCSQNGKKQTATAKKQDSLPLPRATIIANLPDSNSPRETFLSEAPQPLMVAIPTKPGKSYIAESSGGYETIQLLPPPKHTFTYKITQLPIAPEAQAAGFFTTYDTEDGLALDAILCSMEDKKGNLWFGTAGGGVSKFNGKYFLNYTTVQGLAYNTVNVIYEDKSGNLWFGTSGGGVSKYDGRYFVNFSEEQGLASNSVSSVLEDNKGNIWFGTGDGVSKYDGKIFKTFTNVQGLGDNSVWSIIEDKKGNLWFGTNGGVSEYDGKSFKNYTPADGLPAKAVLCMVQDKSGIFWFGTRGGGVSKFDGKSIVNYTTEDGLAGNKVVSMMEDRTGNLWFGTYGGGVSKYNGTFFVNFTTSQGLAGDVVAGITEDKTGNLWFGLYGGGVSKYNGKSFVNYTTAHGLANNVVRSIAEDKSGNLWFGTNGGGISKYDGHSFENYSTAQGLPSNLCYCITEDKNGILWFGTLGGGLIKLDGKSFTNYTTLQGLASNGINCIAEDNIGNLWIGTNGGGLSKFNGKSFVNFTTAQGLANNTVQCMASDKSGNLWFGTNEGMSKFDGKSFVNYTTEQGLVNNIINSITLDESDNLWIGTEEGLSLLRSENAAGVNSALKGNEIFSGQLFENFTTNNGLPDSYVTQVIQDNKNKYYVGTNLGICELLNRNTLNGNQNEWIVGKTFNTQTGYPVKDVNVGQNTLFKDSKGIIWIATGSDKTGLVRFNPAEVHSNPTPPVLVIHNVKINNESMAWNNLHALSKRKVHDSTAVSNAAQPGITEEITTFGKFLSEAERNSMGQKFSGIRFKGINKWYPVPENLVIPHQYNSIGFEFTAIDPGGRFLIKYQYILEGSDKDWSPISNKSFANFDNLFEGTYTFRLKAQNTDGIWSQPIEYTFVVLPPWWRTWWMYLIYLFAFLAALRLFSKWRERRIMKEKEALENKVMDRTEQLNQSLEQLKSTQAQLIQSEKMASLGELTAGIAHEIKNPLNFINNFSEVNNELIDEMKDELAVGNQQLAIEIADDIKQNLEKINQHGKRADAIIKGMLQHSRSSSGQKELADINTLCDEYLRLCYHGLRAKDKSFNSAMKTDFDNSIGNINIIPQDIGRVVLNLLTNAFYAVDEKKKQQPEGYEPTVSISTKKIGEKVEIKVSDNGNGIPMHVMEKIFQPFFTTKPTGQGTGLGLSLSYDIITKGHGGELKAETKEGEFTTFRIDLPMQS